MLYCRIYKTYNYPLMQNQTSDMTTCACCTKKVSKDNILIYTVNKYTQKYCYECYCLIAGFKPKPEQTGGR